MPGNDRLLDRGYTYRMYSATSAKIFFWDVRKDQISTNDMELVSCLMTAANIPVDKKEDISRAPYYLGMVGKNWVYCLQPEMNIVKEQQEMNWHTML